MFTLPEILHETFVAVFASVVIAIAVAIFGKMKEKWSWPTMIVYGLVVACCVLFIFGRLWPPAWRERVTVENVEDKLNQWIRNFRLASQKQPSSSTCYFNYFISAFPGVPEYKVSVVRTTAFPSYLVLRIIVEGSADQLQAYESLTPNGKHKFISELLLELSKARVHVVRLELPINFPIEKLLPITSDLSEGVFIDSLSEINREGMIGMAAIDTCLERSKEIP